jgi:hypothetical protein
MPVKMLIIDERATIRHRDKPSHDYAPFGVIDRDSIQNDIKW